MALNMNQYYVPKLRSMAVPDVPVSAFNQETAVRSGNRLLAEAWSIASGLSSAQPTRDHLVAVMEHCRALVRAASGDRSTVEELMGTMEQLAERNVALESGWLEFSIRNGVDF
jgi:hypothetical protein